MKKKEKLKKFSIDMAQPNQITIGVKRYSKFLN